MIYKGSIGDPERLRTVILISLTLGNFTVNYDKFSMSD
jgi:hypothetical protein